MSVSALSQYFTRFCTCVHTENLHPLPDQPDPAYLFGMVHMSTMLLSTSLDLYFFENLDKNATGHLDIHTCDCAFSFVDKDFGGFIGHQRLRKLDALVISILFPLVVAVFFPIAKCYEKKYPGTTAKGLCAYEMQMQKN